MQLFVTISFGQTLNARKSHHRILRYLSRIYMLQCGFFNLSMDPPSYPKSFFTTGSAVGAWVGMRTHMQAPRCLWKRRNLRTSADPNIVDYFSPPLAEKWSDIGSEWMAQLFLQVSMLLGKGALFAKTRRQERQTWSKCSLAKMERLKKPHCKSQHNSYTPCSEVYINTKQCAVALGDWYFAGWRSQLTQDSSHMGNRLSARAF